MDTKEHKEIAFSETVSQLFNNIETLSAYFLNELKSYRINDLRCRVFIDRYLHKETLRSNSNDGRLCFILSQQVTNNNQKFDRQVVIAIDTERCRVTFNFVRDPCEREEFEGSITKLTEEKFMDVLVSFFITHAYEYEEKENRVALIAKLN
jgi:hypothetical protein